MNAAQIIDRKPISRKKHRQTVTRITSCWFQKTHAEEKSPSGTLDKSNNVKMPSADANPHAFEGQKLQYRKDIDGLRAIAVGSVVLFHASIPGFSGGFVGVDIFFVISGFLITTIIKNDLEKGTFSLLDFYDRRIRRIFPALFTVYLAVFVAGFAVLFPEDLKALAKSLLGSSVFGANIHFHGKSGYFDAPSISQPLLHTWSLSVEEQFYVVWPLLMSALVGLAQPRLWLPLLLLSSFILSLAYAEIEIWKGNAETAFFMPQARAWELIMGALLAFYGSQITFAKISREALAAAGLLLISGSIFLLSENHNFPGFNALFPCIGAAFIIAAGRQSPTAVSRVLSLQPMVFIGLISYSLYLWHWPLFSFWHHLILRAPNIGESIILIILSVLLATITWRYVETRFRRRNHEQQSRAKFTIRAGLAAISVVAVGGYIVVFSEGLPNRFDPAINAIYKVAEERNFGSACPFEGIGSEIKPECLLGSKAKARPIQVVLVGDSHGYHFAAAIDGVLKRHDLSGRLITRAGCIALPGIYIDPSNTLNKKRKCAEFSTSISEFFKNDTESKLVIISLRWETYAKFKPGHARDDNKITNVNVSMSNERLEHVLRRNIELLSAHGKRVLLIGQVPPHKTSPLRCVTRTLHAHDNVNQCSITVPEVNERIGYTNALLRNVALQFKMVDAFIPADTLCRDGSCPVFLNGIFLYRDDDHINDAGSREFAKYISKLPLFSELYHSKLGVVNEDRNARRNNQ